MLGAQAPPARELQTGPTPKRRVLPRWHRSLHEKPHRTLAKVNIVARERWGAHVTKDNDLWVTTPVVRVVLAYTQTDQCTTIKECRDLVKVIQRADIKEGYRDIRYNFVVGNDGNIYEGRGWKASPTLKEEHQELCSTSLYIAVCGQFTTSTPPQPAYQARENLIRYGVGVNLIERTYSRIYDL